MRWTFEVWKQSTLTLGGKELPSGRSITLRYFAIISFSIIFATLSSGPDVEFLSGYLTVFAILVGFSFSASLFFAGQEMTVIVDRSSLEQEEKQEKIDNLAEQIFFNINYFNVASLLAIVIGMFASLKVPDVVNYLRFGHETTVLMRWCGRFFLCLIAVESILTFTLILRRMRYLFDNVQAARVLARQKR